jgi:hypothetical protein
MVTVLFVGVLATLGFLCFTGPGALSVLGIVTESNS